MRVNPRHLAVALVLLAGSSASAQTLTGETDFNHSPLNVAVTIHGLKTETTYANNFLTTVSPGNPSGFATYCVDIFHFSNGTPGGENPQAVQLIQASSFTSGKDLTANGRLSPSTAAYQEAGLGRAAWLANNYGLAADLGTDDQRAGLQLAIWKVEYETQANLQATHSSRTGDALTVTAGAINFSFDTRNTHASDYVNATEAANVTAIADAYLTDSFKNGAYQTAIANWVSYRTAQDQIAIRGDSGSPFTAPVPEPASLAMCGTALLIVSGLAWKRRRKNVVPA